MTTPRLITVVCFACTLVAGPGCRRAPVCGDGIVNGREGCDLGGANDDRGACTTACEPARCGDGLLQTSERCDDGNLVHTDGCSAQCTICGDGIPEGLESCDDGNDVLGDGCFRCRARGEPHDEFAVGGGDFFAGELADGTMVTYGYRGLWSFAANGTPIAHIDIDDQVVAAEVVGGTDVVVASRRRTGHHTADAVLWRLSSELEVVWSAEVTAGAELAEYPNGIATDGTDVFVVGLSATPLGEGRQRNATLFVRADYETGALDVVARGLDARGLWQYADVSIEPDGTLLATDEDSIERLDRDGGTLGVYELPWPFGWPEIIGPRGGVRVSRTGTRDNPLELAHQVSGSWWLVGESIGEGGTRFRGGPGLWLSVGARRDGTGVWLARHDDDGSIVWTTPRGGDWSDVHLNDALVHSNGLVYALGSRVYVVEP